VVREDRNALSAAVSGSMYATSALSVESRDFVTTLCRCHVVSPSVNPSHPKTRNVLSPSQIDNLEHLTHVKDF
jgi:hypothetical protein